MCCLLFSIQDYYYLLHTFQKDGQILKCRRGKKSGAFNVYIDNRFSSVGTHRKKNMRLSFLSVWLKKWIAKYRRNFLCSRKSTIFKMARLGLSELLLLFENIISLLWCRLNVCFLLVFLDDGLVKLVMVIDPVHCLKWISTIVRI